MIALIEKDGGAKKIIDLWFFGKPMCNVSSNRKFLARQDGQQEFSIHA